MLKEDIKLYVYKFSESFTSSSLLDYFLRKNDCSACIFNSNMFIILDKNFGNFLVTPNRTMRPTIIGNYHKKFIGNYKKRSINTYHKVHMPFGNNGSKLIKHYSESIINNLNEL